VPSVVVHDAPIDGRGCDAIGPSGVVPVAGVAVEGVFYRVGDVVQDVVAKRRAVASMQVHFDVLGFFFLVFAGLGDVFGAWMKATLV